MIFFLILSSMGALLLLIGASPSSLYCPTVFLPIKLDNLSERYKPTSSQTLALSKLPIVTPNNVLSPFLTQILPLLKSSNFLSCFIALMAFSLMFVKYSTYLMKLFKILLKWMEKNN